VGTRYKGVYRYDGKTFTRVLQNGRFDTYTVLSIIEDKSGNIWFGTEAAMKQNEKPREAYGDTMEKHFKNISKKDDLSHPAVWSILEDKSGNLWIGTRNTGLCRFDGKTFTSFSD
jgi:ligand-binding sensor domain-containing protein